MKTAILLVALSVLSLSFGWPNWIPILLTIIAIIVLTTATAQ